MRKGWKVIDEDRRSITRSLSNPCSRHYEIGELVRPTAAKCGPLAVFKTHRAAAHFLRGVLPGAARVVRCEYTPSRARALYDLNCSKYRRELPLEKTPRGTVFARAVRCLE